MLLAPWLPLFQNSFSWTESNIYCIYTQFVSQWKYTCTIGRCGPPHKQPVACFVMQARVFTWDREGSADDACQHEIWYQIYFITRSARLILSSDEDQLIRKPNASFWSCWDSHLEKNRQNSRQLFNAETFCCFIWMLKSIKTKNSTQISSFIESQATFGIFSRWIFPRFFSLTKKIWLGKKRGRRDVFDRGRCHWNLSFWAYPRDFVTYLRRFWWHGNYIPKTPWVFGKRLFIFFWFCWCIC